MFYICVHVYRDREIEVETETETETEMEIPCTVTSPAVLTLKDSSQGGRNRNTEQTRTLMKVEIKYKQHYGISGNTKRKNSNLSFADAIHVNKGRATEITSMLSSSPKLKGKKERKEDVFSLTSSFVLLPPRQLRKILQT